MSEAAWTRKLVAVLVIAVGALCALVLPFLVGSRGGPVYAATYALGADNRAAAVALGVLSLGVLGWTFFGGLTVEEERTAPIAARLLTIGAVVVALWTVLLGVAIARAGVRFGESAYFLERMRDIGTFGGRLYTDFEWPYGPLLLLPPVWAHRMGVPLLAANFAWLAMLNVAGVLLAGYVLNRLPLGQRVRVGLFAMFCFEQMHPLAGANYSLGKFMLPFAVLVYGNAVRGGWRRYAAFAGGMLLTLLVSPELGVGLGAGVVGWACVRAVRDRQTLDVVYASAPVVGIAAFAAMYGRGFLDRLGHAAGGALNLVLEPLPHVLILVAAVVWLAPRAVGARLGSKSVAADKSKVNNKSAKLDMRLLPRYDGALLAGLYLVSLGLLPGAVGRADPLHVFFNGFGFLVLGFIGLRGRARVLWGVAVALLAMQVQATNFAIYRPMLRALVHPAPQPALDVQRLRQETGGAPVAVPALFTMPLADELALRQANLFVADKVPGLAETWTPADEAEKIARMRAAGWALVPQADYTQAEGSPNTSRLKRLLRLGYTYPQKHEPYVVGRMLQAELAGGWVAVDEFGGEVLYRRR